MSKQAALKSAAAFLDQASWDETIAAMKPKVADFVSGKQSILFGLKPLAQIAGCRAFLHQIEHGQDVSVDWNSWQLGKELLLLDFRANASGGARTMSSWSVISPDLDLGISLSLMGQTKMAKTVLQSVQPRLANVVQRIELGLGKQLDLSVFGHILDLETGTVPTHPAFTRSVLSQGPRMLETAAAARKDYAKAGNSGGSLLAGPECDLVPVELVYLNKSLGLADPKLDDMAQQIATTSYPENDDFVELDTELTVAGY